MTMKILDLYRHLISAGALSADEDGYMSITFGELTQPATIDGKRMVLPTPKQLKAENWDDRIVFHPLSEHLWRNESPVMARFRKAINNRLNYTLGRLGEELLATISEQSNGAKMSPTQQEILTAVPGVDDKVLKVFKQLLLAMGLGDINKCIVHMFLRKNAEVDGRPYKRAAIITSPLYEELSKAIPKDAKAEDKHIYGVTVSAKQRDTLKALLRFLMPGIDKPGYFNRGSESLVAPYLDALMKGLLAVGENINTVVETYVKFLKDPESYQYDDEWVEVFDNLEQMLPQIRMIPMQAGNEGSVEGAAAQPTPQLPPMPAAPQAWSPPPSYPAQPQQQQYPQPFLVTAPAVYPNAPGVAPAVVKTASGTIDMDASLRRNPQLAATLSPPVYDAYGQQAQAPMAQPRWAQTSGYAQPAPGYGQQPSGYSQPAPYVAPGGRGIAGI